MLEFPKMVLFLNGRRRAVHNALTETKAIVEFALENANKKEDL